MSVHIWWRFSPPLLAAEPLLRLRNSATSVNSPKLARYGVATISRLLKIIDFSFAEYVLLYMALLQKRPMI